MPIRVQDELPAVNFLRNENVFVMTTTRATTQEIRPLKVLILPPDAEENRDGNQFLRLLSNSRCSLISSFCVSMRVNHAIRQVNT
jgi:homoserine O-succinyltransferase